MTRSQRVASTTTARLSAPSSHHSVFSETPPDVRSEPGKVWTRRATGPYITGTTSTNSAAEEGGAHTAAPLMGVPATGKTITLAGINIFRVHSDRIVERWGRLDEAGLLRQLGLITS
jgi:SnoaL-like polyketide cyclase